MAARPIARRSVRAKKVRPKARIIIPSCAFMVVMSSLLTSLATGVDCNIASGAVAEKWRRRGTHEVTLRKIAPHSSITAANTALLEVTFSGHKAHRNNQHAGNSSSNPRSPQRFRTLVGA